MALNFSLQRTSQEANTLSLRGLMTRWAGTRRVTSFGRPTTSGSGAGAGGATPGATGFVGGSGTTGLFSVRFQAIAISTLEPCWELSPRPGPGGTPVSGNVAVTL